MTTAMHPFNQPLNEIIFEKRNKTYGAYVLRREYADSLKIGILISSGFITLIVVLMMVFNRGSMEKLKVLLPKMADTGLVWVTPPPVADPPKELVNHRKAILPIEKPSLLGDPTPTDKPEKLQALPDVPTQQTSNLPGDVDTTRGSSIEESGTLPATASEKTNADPLLYATKMPEIEGGILPYVSSHLKYPALAVENRTQGVVQISFVVEPDGSISNIEILRKIGDGCEAEAIRVIKSAKWIPGENNKKPVRVKLCMPVRYQLQ
jgi:protein TonB